MSSAKSNGNGNSWFIIVLKVIAYAIGLVLAGIGTTATAHACGLF